MNDKTKILIRKIRFHLEAARYGDFNDPALTHIEVEVMRSDLQLLVGELQQRLKTNEEQYFLTLVGYDKDIREQQTNSN